ncbi:HD domain-containing protein [Saccharothrix coeruleofusca]|nr:HD domain-containing protein [Saccharothrix coeruleofusca]MBP2334238.1 (p)ppGpp synthase/HD superfamily hydrolase [Saccharothrix coeruleofusca]
MAFTVADAVRIARAAHEGQVDKSGRPYIGHPLRVMERVTGDHARMAAVLHDVVEDTGVSAADLLAAGCPRPVVDTVVALTHLPGESQEDYLSRVAADPVAVVVKRADIADNTSPERMARLDAATRTRLRDKYARALQLLDTCS